MVLPFEQPAKQDIRFEETLHKLADQTISGTTFTDDTHIQGMELVAGANYKVTGCLLFDSTADGSGIKFRLVSSNNMGASCALHSHTIDSAGTAHVDLAHSVTSTILQVAAITTLRDDLEPTAALTGLIVANASTNGTLKLQWARNSVSGSSLILRKGSWLTLNRMTGQF